MSIDSGLVLPNLSDEWELEREKFGLDSLCDAYTPVSQTMLVEVVEVLNADTYQTLAQRAAGVSRILDDREASDVEVFMKVSKTNS